MTVRVLVITDLFPPVAFGGYERTCAVLVDGLRERHAVTVLTSDLRHASVPEQPWIRRELMYLGPRRRDALRVPLAAARAAALTRSVIADVRPDIVYVWNCLGISQAAPCAALESGVPVAYRLSELWFASSLYRGDRFVGHLNGSRRALHRPWGWLVRAANRHPALRMDTTRPVPAAVSWCSDDLRGRVALPACVRPVLERTIHSGVRLAALPRRPSPRTQIAYLGRVTVAKGAEVAVRAVATLRAAHGIEAELVLAGPCEAAMARRIRRLARQLGIEHRVELAGPLDGDAVAVLLQRTRAVVVPTIAHEAFGRVCVEAALARVPVVASRIGGIPEALHDREHALLFEPGDVAGCAAALAETLRDRPAAKARAARAFEHAQQFSVERFVAAEEAFLQEAGARLRAA
jgi:glycosyltransferase involved in cell wall biosynthesis